jgi:hypothetical protein
LHSGFICTRASFKYLGDTPSRNQGRSPLTISKNFPKHSQNIPKASKRLLTRSIAISIYKQALIADSAAGQKNSGQKIRGAVSIPYFSVPYFFCPAAESAINAYKQNNK